MALSELEWAAVRRTLVNFVHAAVIAQRPLATSKTPAK
jgi:hypothetical protein